MHMNTTETTKASSETPIWDAAYTKKVAARDALMDAARARMGRDEFMAFMDLVFDFDTATRSLANTPLR